MATSPVVGGGFERLGGTTPVPPVVAGGFVGSDGASFVDGLPVSSRNRSNSLLRCSSSNLRRFSASALSFSLLLASLSSLNHVSSSRFSGETLSINSAPSSNDRPVAPVDGGGFSGVGGVASLSVDYPKTWFPPYRKTLAQRNR